MKKIIIVIAVLFFCLLVLGFLKDQLIKGVFNVAASGIVGAPTRVGGFSWGILTQKIRVNNFKMHNPEGFPDGILLDLPKAYVDYDLLALLKGKLHLKSVVVELKEVGLVKNKDGKLNVDSLKVAKQEAEKSKEARKEKSARQMALQIDKLTLDIGRIVMKDYSVEGEPAVQVYDINLKKSYKNINSPQQLVALILSEPMKAAGIRGAAIYGAAMLAGVAVLPVAIGATFVGKDSAQMSFDKNFDAVYIASLEVLMHSGKVTKEDRERGRIDAEVNKANITLKLKKLTQKTTQITVSARKYLLPKPEIANGVIYQITEQLK